MAAGVKAAIVLVTAGDEEQANRLARVLVDEGLAACVNIIGPIRSVYMWRDAVEEEPEYLLLIKSRASLYARVERRVKELHSYEVPEVLAVSPSSGSRGYLRWLADSTARASKRDVLHRRARVARQARKLPLTRRSGGGRLARPRK